MVTPADELYSYHFDAIGNTIAITDNSQQVVNAYAYTPFGIITNKQEAISQPFAFVGQHGVMTEPNGLYYMRARYFDPHTGRFISQDPLGFDGGDVNLYIYAQNNPIIYTDPNGEFLQSLVAGSAAGGIVGGISFVTELAKGASLKDAAKTALISGVTTGVSVGLAASGIGSFVAGAAATAVNAGMQKVMMGNVNVMAAAASALPPSLGGYFLGKAGAVGLTHAVTTGIVSGPGVLAGNTFFANEPQNIDNGK
jgi:RHS repeat-associated protein